MEQNELEFDNLRERHALAMERIRQICTEETAPGSFGVYFRKVASFLVQMKELWDRVENKSMEHYSLEQWKQENEALYHDTGRVMGILPARSPFLEKLMGGCSVFFIRSLEV